MRVYKNIHLFLAPIMLSQLKKFQFLKKKYVLFQGCICCNTSANYSKKFKTCMNMALKNITLNRSILYGNFSACLSCMQNKAHTILQPLNVYARMRSPTMSNAPTTFFIFTSMQLTTLLFLLYETLHYQKVVPSLPLRTSQCLVKDRVQNTLQIIL